jgi:hypothetical protein
VLLQGQPRCHVCQLLPQGSYDSLEARGVWLLVRQQRQGVVDPVKL